MMTDSNKFRLNSRINIRHKSFKKDGFQGHHPRPAIQTYDFTIQVQSAR